MHTAPWIITGLMLTTAGCGSNADDTAKKTNSKTAQSQSSTFESPLNDAMGTNTSPESMDRMQQKAEKAIKTCMAKEGFQYIPVIAKSISFDSTSEDFPGPENPDWRKKYGYGIIIQRLDPSSNAFLGPDLETKDPNQGIVEKMSKAERRAYYIALDGFDPDATAPDGPPPELSNPEQFAQTFELKGCRNEAYAEMNANVFNNPDNDALIQEIYESLEKKMNEDPEMKKLMSSYKKCTAKAGFPELKNISSGYDLVAKKLEAALPSNGAGDQSAKSGISFSTGEGDGTVIGGGGIGSPELTEAQKATLKDLLKEEIQIAQADFGCQKKLDYQVTQNDIRIRVEEEVATDRRDDIANLKPSAPGAGGQD